MKDDLASGIIKFLGQTALRLAGRMHESVVTAYPLPEKRRQEHVVRTDVPTSTVWKPQASLLTLMQFKLCHASSLQAVESGQSSAISLTLTVSTRSEGGRGERTTGFLDV